MLIVDFWSISLSQTPPSEIFQIKCTINSRKISLINLPVFNSAFKIHENIINIELKSKTIPAVTFSRYTLFISLPSGFPASLKSPPAKLDRGFTYQSLCRYYTCIIIAPHAHVSLAFEERLKAEKTNKGKYRQSTHALIPHRCLISFFVQRRIIAHN